MDRRKELLESIASSSNDESGRGLGVQSTYFRMFKLCTVFSVFGVSMFIFGQRFDSNRAFHETTSDPIPNSSLVDSRPRSRMVPNETSGEQSNIQTLVTNEAGRSIVLEATGNVVARIKTTVSSKVFGLIKTVYIDEGMIVEQGQVLAELDDALQAMDLEIFKLQSRRLESVVDSKKAELLEAIRVLDREQELNSRGFSNEASITSATTNVELTKSLLDISERNLDIANLQIRRQEQVLKDLVITAPFRGVVIERNAQAGEIISPSAGGVGFTRTGICTIIDLDSLEIAVDVNESLIRSVYVGQIIEGRVNGNSDLRIDGSVLSIVPAADRASATVRVRIRIAQLDYENLLLPEMAVRISFFE